MKDIFQEENLKDRVFTNLKNQKPYIKVNLIKDAEMEKENLQCLMY
jgi:hypothetical protein